MLIGNAEVFCIAAQVSLVFLIRCFLGSFGIGEGLPLAIDLNGNRPLPRRLLLRLPQLPIKKWAIFVSVSMETQRLEPVLPNSIPEALSSFQFCLFSKWQALFSCLPSFFPESPGHLLHFEPFFLFQNPDDPSVSAGLFLTVGSTSSLSSHTHRSMGRFRHSFDTAPAPGSRSLIPL